MNLNPKKLYLSALLALTASLLPMTLAGCCRQTVKCNDGELIGTLSASGHNVFINNAQARSGMKVCSGDQISTGSGSSAIVLFEKGGFSQLDENTDPWYVIERIVNGYCYVIKMATGNSVISTPSPAVCLKYETPDGGGDVNSSVNIRIMPEQTEVTVIEGKVTIDHENSVSIVSSEQALISQGKIKQIRQLSKEEMLDTVSWRKNYNFPELHPDPCLLQPLCEPPISDSCNRAMQEMASLRTDIKDAEKRIDQNIQKGFNDLGGQVDKIDERVKELQSFARQSGTGEVTVFFPFNGDTLRDDSPEYTRLENFLNYLARNSRGRKIILVVVGSASVPGTPKYNLDLSKRRAAFAAKVADASLINIPHEIYKIYGVGAAYSKAGIDNKRYQYARVIAIYDTDQIPLLPKPIDEQTEMMDRQTIQERNQQAP